MAVLASAGTAIAAQWNSLSGTCHSDLTWAWSDKDRHVTTPNDTIKLYTTALPSGSLQLFVVRASDQSQFGSTVTYSSNNVTKVIATNVANSTVFNNVFRQTQNGSGHTWSGSQYY